MECYVIVDLLRDNGPFLGLRSHLLGADDERRLRVCARNRLLKVLSEQLLELVVFRVHKGAVSLRRQYILVRLAAQMHFGIVVSRSPRGHLPLVSVERVSLMRAPIDQFTRDHARELIAFYLGKDLR